MRPALVTIALVLLLISAGCVKNTPDNKDGGTGTKGKTAQEDKAADTSPQFPEVVVKTDNQVSNREAGQVLDEVDKQLSEVLSTLDRMDDVDDQDLKY